MRLSSILRALRLIVSRGTILRTSHGTVPRSAQVQMLLGEVADGVHFVQHFGFVSRPLVGAEVAIACAGGDRSHPMIVGSLDRRYPGPILEPGEMAIFTAGTSYIHLKNGGEIRIVGDVTIEGSATVDGDLSATGDVRDGIGSLDELRTAYNVHTHVADGTPTSPPSPTVGV